MQTAGKIYVSTKRASGSPHSLRLLPTSFDLHDAVWNLDIIYMLDMLYCLASVQLIQLWQEGQRDTMLWFQALFRTAGGSRTIFARTHYAVPLKEIKDSLACMNQDWMDILYSKSLFITFKVILPQVFCGIADRTYLRYGCLRWAWFCTYENSVTISNWHSIRFYEC